MNKKIIILIVFLIFIFATILSANLILNGDDVLKNFSIVNVSNDNNEYLIEYEKVPASVRYKIRILDNNNVLVFEKETKKTSEKINLSNLIYGTNYSLMVYAYNQYGEVRPASKPYLFTYLEPSFNKDNSLVLNDQDYYLQMAGDFSSKNYQIRVRKNNEEIINEKLSVNNYFIDKKWYVNESIFLTIDILYKDKVVDTITLFNKMNPISDISIISPFNDEKINYNDLTLNFNGGDNASNYIIKVYNKKNKLIKTSNTTKKSVVLSKNLFNMNELYTIEVVATYKDFNKSSKVKFSILDKEQVSAVYLNVNNLAVKKGTLIELKTDTEDANIYYTINGDDPNINGILYTDPIEVKSNFTLKTIATKDDYYNSNLKEYNIVMNDKKNLSVYISPSNQLFNVGVSAVGFTNERDEMNDIADYVSERLKKYGVKVYRNNPATNIYAWLKDSSYYGVDVHIAIHSNASDSHKAYGVETWIDNENSKMLGLSHLVQNNLYELYPYKDKVSSNRGVKLANGALAEVNSSYIENSLLVEIAYHDYLEDAKWIMENKKEIGYNIADSILEYYQIK